MAKHPRNKAWQISGSKTKNSGPSRARRPVGRTRRPGARDKPRALEDLVQQLQKELKEQMEKTEVVERRNEALRKEVRQMKREQKKVLKPSKSGTTSSRFCRAQKNSFGFPCSQKQRELDQLIQSHPDHALPETSEAAGWPNTVFTDSLSVPKDNSGFNSHRNLASGADVIALASSLNSDILHAASIITETFPRLYSPDPRVTNDVETFAKAREQTQITLGIDLLHALTSQCHDPQSITGTSGLGPTLLLIAMQAVMVTFCVNVIQNSTWSQADDKQKLLSEVYDNIREQEQQVVAAKWRVITRAACREPANLEPLTDTLTEILSDVWATAVQLDKVTITRIFCDKFRGQLQVVIMGALRLQAVAWDHITWMDIEPRTIFPGVRFDSNIMEDVDGGNQRTMQDPPVVSKSGSAIVERVLATTELGLWRTMKTSAGIQQDTLLKPKVILRSVLREEGITRKMWSILLQKKHGEHTLRLDANGILTHDGSWKWVAKVVPS